MAHQHEPLKPQGVGDSGNVSGLRLDRVVIQGGRLRFAMAACIEGHGAASLSQMVELRIPLTAVTPKGMDKQDGHAALSPVTDVKCSCRASNALRHQHLGLPFCCRPRMVPLLPTLRIEAKLPILRMEQALPMLSTLAKLNIDQRLHTL